MHRISNIKLTQPKNNLYSMPGTRLVTSTALRKTKSISTPRPNSTSA